MPERLFPPKDAYPVRIVALALPMAAAFLIAKGQKLSALTESIEVGDAVAIMASDIAWVAALTGIFLVGGRIPKARPWLGGLFHLMAPVLTTLAIVEHAFFLSTGAIADGFLALEALARMDEVAPILESEMTPFRWVSLGAPVLWSILVAILLPFFRSRLALVARPLWRLGFPLLGLAGMVIVLIGFGALPDPTPAVRSLTRNVFGGFLADSYDMWNPAKDRTEVTTAILRPIELTRRPGAPAPKNVLILVLESTSAKATSLYEDHRYPMEQPTTPNLERIAEDGLLVETAYTVVPHTSKALVSIHCGIYPKFTIKIEEARGGGIPSACIPRLLREQGFATGFFQTAEQNYENRSELVREMGFEQFMGKEGLVEQGYADGFDESSYFGFEDDVLIRPLFEWIDKQKKPFLGSVLTVTPHHPYSVPAGFPKRDFVKSERLNDY
ncbi:MAG: sulfatase-like hydrolase/transferase, partial [Myxococcales bacterium]|nr:sulfatase-like hydrolase/transferase [Myxococcales bacterium]